MNPPQLTIAQYVSSETAAVIMAITVVGALVLYLRTNLSPGGMIVPGVLVLSALEGLPSLLTVLAITGLVYGIMIPLKAKLTILYGKRLFVTNLVLSTVFTLTAFVALHRQYPTLFANDTLGLLAPGLISYQLFRQKILPTIISTAVVTIAGLAVALAGLSL